MTSAEIALWNLPPARGEQPVLGPGKTAQQFHLTSLSLAKILLGPCSMMLNNSEECRRMWNGVRQSLIAIKDSCNKVVFSNVGWCCRPCDLPGCCIAKKSRFKILDMHGPQKPISYQLIFNFFYRWSYEVVVQRTGCGSFLQCREVLRPSFIRWVGKLVAFWTTDHSKKKM